MASTQRHSVADIDNFRTVLPLDGRRGIYVLEFENGERYVGKATDVAQRLYQHRRTTMHHKAWTDIAAVQFRPVPTGDLSEPELAEIRRQRAVHTLRNRVHNLGHEQPCTLNAVIDPDFQKTWLDRAASPDRDAIVQRAGHRIGKHARATNSAWGPEIIADLATLIELFIPAPTETEGRFWSLTDYPPTGRGRAFTLNIGGVELSYCARPGKDAVVPPTVALNAPAGTFTLGSGGKAIDWVRRVNRQRTARKSDEAVGSANFDTVAYNTTGECNRLRTPAGTLLDVLRGVGTPQQSAESIREMSLAVMRQGATPWAKSHSRSLATMAFREISEREPIELPERGALAR